MICHRKTSYFFGCSCHRKTLMSEVLGGTCTSLWYMSAPRGGVAPRKILKIYQSSNFLIPTSFELEIFFNPGSLKLFWPPSLCGASKRFWPPPPSPTKLFTPPTKVFMIAPCKWSRRWSIWGNPYFLPPTILLCGKRYYFLFIIIMFVITNNVT